MLVLLADDAEDGDAGSNDGGDDQADESPCCAGQSAAADDTGVGDLGVDHEIENERQRQKDAEEDEHIADRVRGSDLCFLRLVGCDELGIFEFELVVAFLQLDWAVGRLGQPEESIKL